MRFMALVSVICIFTSHMAMAADIVQRGQVATISGRIDNGDQFVLRDLLASPQGKQIRVIYLNSPGGSIFPMKEMARSIRNGGISTVVDGSTSICSSACTGLFVAGVSRHYINSGSIADGQQKARGLGFHEGNTLGRTGQRDYSGGATAEMINIYYEMGVSSASGFATKAGFNGMYYISGQTAIATGVATSLSRP